MDVAQSLTESLTKQAISCVHEIADSIKHGPKKGRSAEAALFWFYYSSLDDSPQTETLGMKSLDLAAEELNEPVSIRPYLLGGSIGRAWILNNIVDDPDYSYLRPFDEALLSVLSDDRFATEDAGVISGLSGMLIYGMDRFRRTGQTVGADICTQAILRIRKLAVRNEQGVHWPTSQSAVHEDDLESFPNGLTYCGTGHGAAGIIATLARAHQLGLGACDDLVLGGQDWLASQRVADLPLWQEPHKVAPGRSTLFPPWMAWCSGALSTSLMQLQAAVALGSITDSVRSRLLACAEVRVDSFPTDDAALCHGSLGHAYMFHRGWLATGEAKLRDAANQWTAYALAQRSADPSLPGFVRVKSGKALNHGFTEGKVGIALALLTLAGVISPTWDGLLGFSVPLPRRN